MTEVYIIDSLRTPIGNFNGTLANVPAHDLGRTVIENLIEKNNLSNNEIDEVILGQVLFGNQGQNPARQASINAGLSMETPAWTVSQVCGSGLKSIALAFQNIKIGDAEIIVAGGQENMSLCPHAIHLRNGTKMGHNQLTDMMVYDGLTDAFSNIHMGITAENIAKKFNITREEQDEFAKNSQNKAELAQKNNKFKDEIVPVKIATRKGDIIFSEDEFIKKGVTLDSLSQLKPAFLKEGTITAGNASGINDGAAACLLMSDKQVKQKNLNPLARIVSWAQAGVDPLIMGTGPIPAVKKALDKAGWKIEDLNLIESNEAFAAQAISVNKSLGWDTSIVNVNGGAIAIGHPIGASGARVLTTLVHEMKRRNVKKGIATLCIGGGMGIAVCVER